MSSRFCLFFIFFTFLFLFYPGYNPHLSLIANHQSIFSQTNINSTIKINPIPYQEKKIPPLISAEGVLVVELSSFTPIYSKNEHTKFFPASTTKMVTALVANDLFSPETIITVKNVVSEGQNMGLVPDEKITVENLLYGMLIHSGNDAAFALADYYGREAFISRMNQKAAQLGMKNSYFTNPAGFDDPLHLSTAYDLALAGRAVIADHKLRKIVGIKEITIADVEYKIFHRLNNINKLLGEIQGVGGLKTGYTENAGENLVSFYRHDGHDYLIVVVKSLDRFADTRNLIDWLNGNIRYISPPQDIILN